MVGMRLACLFLLAQDMRCSNLRANLYCYFQNIKMLDLSPFEALHHKACEQGHATYIDPATGYQVLTSKSLLKQGKCCGNSCRHCPYGHINVATKAGDEPQITRPVLMNRSSRGEDLDILFWSGGKDSFLTLMKLIEEGRNVILLTSFGALTKRVSIQNIHIRDIVKQAAHFKVPLCLVPLYPNTEYKQSIESALEMIVDQTCLNIERLVFGDLHLRDIRKWRVDTWHNYKVYTPLFNAPYDELLSKLWTCSERMGLSINLSTPLTTSAGEYPVGTPYNQELIATLQKEGVDLMLENGAAHTIVSPIGSGLY